MFARFSAELPDSISLPLHWTDILLIILIILAIIKCARPNPKNIHQTSSAKKQE